MKTDVRVVLVGDPGVGKTTLVSCVLTGGFQESVPDVAEPLVVPPEDTPDHVTATIIDTPSDTKDPRYAVNQPKSFERITRFWLPELRKLGVKGIPVLLVGNMIDVRGDNILNENLEQEIMPIMASFREVETCVECSAKRLVNVQEVFYFAFKSVVHPTAPLYDPVTHSLKHDAVSALSRIFRLCDKDKDDLLNDEELNDFQVRCFNAPLENEELEGIKKVVQDHTPNGVSAIGPGKNALTLSGFLFLHQLFIQRGRLETAWTVLRKFGYGDTLKISQEFLLPAAFTSSGFVQSEDSIELSNEGIEFLIGVFRACDLDGDDALNKKELKIAFSGAGTSPWGNEFPQETTHCDANGNVTLPGWLAQWQMTLVSDPKIAFKYLYLIGCDDTMAAVKIVNGGNQVRPGRKNKRVFQCYVVGSRGCGKTSFLRAMIGRKFESKHIPTADDAAVSAVCQIEPEDGSGEGSYLILREFGRSVNLIENTHLLKTCDLLCLLYDGSDPASFRDVAVMLEDVVSLSNEITVPVVCVSTKSDLPPAVQTVDGSGIGLSTSASEDRSGGGSAGVSPESFLQSLDLPNPVATSVKTNKMNGIYSMLLDVARVPTISLPLRSGTRNGGNGIGSFINNLVGENTQWMWAVGAGVGLGLVGGLMIYRHVKGKGRK